MCGMKRGGMKRFARRFDTRAPRHGFRTLSHSIAFFVRSLTPYRSKSGRYDTCRRRALRHVFIPCLSLSHTGKSPFGACGRASANWGVCNIARARGAACIFARRIRARRGGCPNKNIKISKFSALASDFSEKAHQLSKCHFVQMSECKSVPSRLVWPEKTSLVLAHAQTRPRTPDPHIPSRLARPAKKLLVCANLVSLSLSSTPLVVYEYMYMSLWARSRVLSHGLIELELEGPVVCIKFVGEFAHSISLSHLCLYVHKFVGECACLRSWTPSA